MNKFIGVGTIASDIESRTTQGGIQHCTFRVAFKRKFKNAEGKYDADFLPVVAWRQTADFCGKYLGKGYKVAVEGSIQTRSYDAKDGIKRYVTEINADSVELVGEPKQAQERQPKQEQFEEVDPGDDLPF